MNPIAFALRRPVTILVAVVGLLVAGGFAIYRIKVDIFPALNLPVIYVCQPYGGLDPAQMEGLIANYYEYHFLYINNIHHVESKNVQGVSLMKLVFHPGTDMAQALAETVANVNRSRAFMPPGTVPPFVMRFDTGSVPVGYLVLSSETKTIAQIQDQALFKVRPMFSAIQGVSAPPPFGGSQRTVVVRADPDRLRSYGISAEQVVSALASGNSISPSGAVRIGDKMPLAPTNAMVLQPKELGAIEVKPGVFLRDVVRRDPASDQPSIDDASDIATGYALVNGKRAVYILVTKKANAGTLEVVRNVRAELPKMQAALPDDIRVAFEFDQSPYVTNAIRGVATEGVLAACLVGLSVFVFLRDWRSVIVVVVNIPLALTAALVALWLSGQSINLMTLGGLALAVGVLVDESTVELENIHVQLRRTLSVPLAVRWGNAETAVPRLLAMLCMLAVFVPALVLQGAAQALFMPLALAVGFSMIASYILSSTLVPVLCVWLLKGHPVSKSGELGVESGESKFNSQLPTPHSQLKSGLLERLISVRWLLVPSYLIGSSAIVWFVGNRLGMEIFPKVDAGIFQVRMKAPVGTRIEKTEAIAQEALRFIGREVGPENIAITLGYVGVVAPSYPINCVYLWMGGPDEAVLRVKLKEGVVRVEDLKARLREKLPVHLRQWMTEQSDVGKIGESGAGSGELRLSFEPADIVNEVMSFGSTTPIEVAVSSAKQPDNIAFAAKVYAELEKIPSLRDLQFAQAQNYPTVEIQLDREQLALAGVKTDAAAKAVVPFTSSSRFTVPNFWRDPASGIGYQVQVEVPQMLINSVKELESIPVRANGEQLLVGDIAKVREGVMPGQVDRYNMRRLISMTANIQGEELGTVAKRIDQAIAAAGKPPQAVQVDVRGQIVPMLELFHGLSFGLGIAIVVILLMLTAYFQSLRLALTAVAAVPAVVAGAVIALFVTGSTLNLQSFMGTIMAVGVAVANAILLVTFADKSRSEGQPSRMAAASGARGRMRPILMTGIAMILGMLPMALGFGDGGDQTAPLGRAVIGGLLASTLTTLFVLPAIFALMMGRKPAAAISLDPFDPASRYFDSSESASSERKQP